MQKILLILFFVPASVLADVHKCVNEGRVTYSEKPCVYGAVFYDAGRVSVADGASRYASIARAESGVFKVDGAVNGLPVKFIVDTGASYTTISGDTAYRLGVKSCAAAGVTNTANGQAAFCRVQVSSLSVSGFNFVNVSVSISPGMRGDSLFGNDLLSRFTVQQRGDVLTLSR